MESGEPGQEVGAQARERLHRSRILIVGVGGLGAPAALHLAAAGVGTLGLVDFDVVEVSNLHRQLLYRTRDIGRPKVTVAAERIRASYPDVSVRCFPYLVSADNASELFPQFDFIIDGTDRVASKYLVNDAAVLCGVSFSHAGVMGFHGQTLTVIPKRSACFRCLFPTPPPEGEIPSCQEAGVIGAIAGTIGMVQAIEALKYVLGVGRVLANRLLIYDTLAAGWRTVELSANPHCPLCGDQPTIQQIESIERAGAVCR